MFNRLYITFVAVVALLCSCSSDKPDSLEPHLQTLPATDITRTEATISGLCQTDNGADMPQLWFRYGADESMSERSEALEAADGSVSMRLRNLTAGTTYYYMLQGGNGTAVLSGETLNFTTLPNLQPTIGDVKVLSSSPMSVIVGYRIADDGGDEIAESGCRISRQDGAAMSDGEKETTIMQTGSVGADGFYRLRIGNLQPSTAYTICPFAKNRNGEAVGEPLSFTTPTAVVLDEAGMLSVVIGDDIYKYTTISIAGPLNGDDEVEIGWSPNRIVRLEYQGDSRYAVLMSHNSKMLPGDSFVTGCFIAKQPLYLPFLERGGERTPPFVAGRNGGLSIVRVVKESC